MKIHPLIAAAILGALFGLQAWTLNEIVNLKVNVATLAAQIHQHANNAQSPLAAR